MTNKEIEIKKERLNELKHLLYEASKVHCIKCEPLTKYIGRGAPIEIGMGEFGHYAYFPTKGGYLYFTLRSNRRKGEPRKKLCVENLYLVTFQRGFGNNAESFSRVSFQPYDEVKVKDSALEGILEEYHTLCEEISGLTVFDKCVLY